MGFNIDSFNSVDFLLCNDIKCSMFEEKLNLKGKVARLKLNINKKDVKYDTTV